MQLPGQPEQMPAHFPASGQPMHLTPFFFSLRINTATRPMISAMTAIMIRSMAFISFSLIGIYCYLPRLYSEASCLLVLRIMPAITAAMATTTARPMTAATMFREAGAVISVPTV